jgi:hypothetical protein
VDLVGIEPTTSSMPWKRAPSCATGPRERQTSKEYTIFAQRQLIVKRTYQMERAYGAKSTSLSGPHGNLSPPPAHPILRILRKFISILWLQMIDLRTPRYIRVALIAVVLIFGMHSVSLAQQATAPISVASASELNQALTQLNQAASRTINDISVLRIDKWKTDSSTKKQSEDNADSLLRNLRGALPGLVNELQGSPENLGATFKLYRNVSALCDVMNNVAENAGAFGPKDDYQALANDFRALDQARRSLADRMDKLATAKDTELSQLRTQVRTLQAAMPPPSPKKVIVDDEPKKPVKKKAPPKTAATPPSSASKPQ